jgi:hypothetical protein
MLHFLCTEVPDLYVEHPALANVELPRRDTDCGWADLFFLKKWSNDRRVRRFTTYFSRTNTG